MGDYFTNREVGRFGAFIERWNGRRWQLAQAPIPGSATLSSVSASGAGDVWAIGQISDGRPLIERWDGERWLITPAPNPRGGSNLFAVAARARDDAWAVGVHEVGGGVATLVEHWDGTRWTVTPSPTPAPARGHHLFARLQAVTAISSTDAWAAGASGGSARSPITRTLIEHWDGRRWTIVPSPSVRSPRGVINNTMFSISGDRPDDAWAVGSWGSEPRGYGGKGDHALALHWDGHRWRATATPALAQRSLFAGVASQHGHAWAVGDQGGHHKPLIERWNGARWVAVPSPSGSGLTAVAMSPSGTAWAVGETGRRPLAARC